MLKTWIVKRQQMMAKGRRKERSVKALAIVAFSLQASSLGFIRDDVYIIRSQYGDHNTDIP